MTVQASKRSDSGHLEVAGTGVAGDQAPSCEGALSSLSVTHLFGASNKMPVASAPSGEIAPAPWPHTQANADMDLYKSIVENLNSALLTLDQELRVTSANPAAEMLFKQSRRQLMGQPIETLIPGNTEFIASLKNSLKSNNPFTARGMKLELTGFKRKITVDYTISPLGPGSENALALEINHMDRLLRLAREERMLRHQATNRAVIKGMAHEIKNPLGGIRGAAQLLARELPNEDLGEYTDIIIQEADRLRALVDRMFGPNQPIKLESLNIHEILEHVIRLVRAENQGNINFERDFDPSLPELQADRHQLIQAVLNLVRNAVQALDQEGTVILRSRVERQFTIGHTRHRHVIRLDIEDNGAGIPPEIMENIFYPMVTGRPEGTGLGLSITQDIIAKHGGLIEWNSRPGLTVFSVYLPLEQHHEPN